MTAGESFHTIHNYIDTENMILRKGAISAYKDEKILIPVNMRDGSILAKEKATQTGITLHHMVQEGLCHVLKLKHH